jgi:hypothetical protein
VKAGRPRELKDDTTREKKIQNESGDVESKQQQRE